MRAHILIFSVLNLCFSVIVDKYNLDECACRCRETPVCVQFDELLNDNGICLLKSTIGHNPRTVTDQMIGTPNC